MTSVTLCTSPVERFDALCAFGREPAPGNHGPVRVCNTSHFAHAAYHFVDLQGRAVTPPGKAGMAVRVRRVGL